MHGHDVTDQIIRILQEEGVVNLTPELLHDVAGDLLEAAREEAHTLFQTQGDRWPGLFHDTPDSEGNIQAGDKKKTISKALGKDSLILKLFQMILSGPRGLMPGYNVARHPNGSHHIVLLHHADESLYPGRHYAQIFHTDMQCTLRKEFSIETLQACLRQDGPRIMWLDLNKFNKTIALCFYLRAHRAARVANLFYARNYAPLLDVYQEQHPGKTESDFYPVWAALVEAHVRDQCKDLQIEAEAVLNTFRPLGGGAWDALMPHAGTSYGGLRAFAVVLKPVDQGQVQLPENIIDPWAISTVYAGIIGGSGSILQQLEVALTNTYVAEHLSASLAIPQKSASAKQKAALLQVLDRVGSDWGLKPTPGHDSKPLSLLFKHQPFFGLVCHGQGQCKAVVWFEFRNSDVQRGCLFRHVAFALRLHAQRMPEGLKPVCSLFDPNASVATLVLEEFSLAYSAVVMEGKPLAAHFQSVLRPWFERRELTEEQRYSIYAVVLAFDALEDAGFRFVVFDQNLLSIDLHYNVRLICAGSGFLGEKKRSQCNRGQFQGPTPLARRNTSLHVDQFLANAEAPAGCNMRRLRRLANDKLDSLVEAASLPVSSVDEQDSSSEEASAWRSWSDSNVRKWLAGENKKGMALLGRYEGDPNHLFIDEDFAKAINDAEDAFSLMDVLRQTDVHQLILWLAGGFRAQAPEKQSFCNMKTMLFGADGVLKKPSMEDACAAMATFLHGLTPLRDMPHRNKELSCHQPEALKRLCEFFISALHPANREDAAAELSYMLFVTTVVHTPGNELLLSGGGIVMKVQLFPFDDDDFKAKVRNMLKETEGLEFPRDVFLRNEGDVGVGVFAPGKWKKGHFFGFYLGTDDNPRGRHVVTSIGLDTKHCDGAASWFLPFSVFLERGTPGSFVNSSWNRAADIRPNLRLDRRKQLTHFYNGKLLVLIPMFVQYDFADAFTSWDYNPNARGGSSFN